MDFCQTSMYKYIINMIVYVAVWNDLKINKGLKYQESPYREWQSCPGLK